MIRAFGPRRTQTRVAAALLAGVAFGASWFESDQARAQITLAPVTVRKKVAKAPMPKRVARASVKRNVVRPPAPRRTRVATRRAPAVRTAGRAAPVETARARAIPTAGAPSAAPAENVTPAAAEAREVAARTAALDAARNTLLAPVGANTYQFGRQAIQDLPQGSNTPVDKVVLQAPGVTQDSAANGSFHVRNEHANVQYRINGIFLPEGVSGAFGQFLDTRLIGSMSLITGALPAQFGLRTSGIIDIQTRSGTQQPGGSIGVYGGSRETITPTFEYGGTVGKTDYFVAGRYFASNEGIENPTPSLNPIHDYTWQGKGLAYTSTLLDENTRLSIITGSSINKFQIPNVPGQVPQFTAFGVGDFDSSLLNDRQWERNVYGVAALQHSANGLDLQLAYFTRHSTVHFVPDTVGDLVFNGIASDVFRRAFVNGVQGDAAYRVNDSHTLRGGFMVSGEQTLNATVSTVLPLDENGNPVDAPLGILDSVAKTGSLLGGYVQDEWRITDRLTVNAGLRFDQMVQFVDANQLSPRLNVVYKPFDGTTFHAGYARYFTPPEQSLAAPTAFQNFANTSAAPGVLQADPVLPERADYFDVGVKQQIMPGWAVGVDAYYKNARDLLDDGRFGQALVLTAFNYAKGYNEGVELSTTYENGNFKAYGNLAWAVQRATDIISNQYLIDPDELAYIATHYIYTDHAQTWTASAGVSYLWNDTRFSADLIYGSGLRNGFANTTHLPGYTQVNLGVSHDFKLPDTGPFTLRFAVVNAFDEIYQLRDGTGIGVFAPQYGPRRGFFLGLSKQI